MADTHPHAHTATHTHTRARQAAHLLEGCACACEGVERGGGDGGREARGKSDTRRRRSETLRRRRRRRGGARLSRNASQNPATGPGPAPGSPRTSQPLRLPGRYQAAPAGPPPLCAALCLRGKGWGGGGGRESAWGPSPHTHRSVLVPLHWGPPARLSFSSWEAQQGCGASPGSAPGEQAEMEFWGRGEEVAVLGSGG